MQETLNKDIGELFDDRESMDRALARAVRQAVLQHKRAGNPVAIWRDGKVAWLNPDEIELPDEDG
jgi:isoaspartyl peptidase/L-asparaginase-like protein (Ntn-hydrolase superfamily)